MRKILLWVVVFAALFPSVALGQDLTDLMSPGAGASGDNPTVNPYVQVGFMNLGSTIALPVNAEGPIAGLLQIDTMDLSLKDANFWTGTVGVNITPAKMLTVFGSAGGILARPFIVSGQVPVSLGPLSTSANIDFDATKVESWFIQTGAGFGPLVLGLYWDHFSVGVGDPREGSVPLANQTLRGDVITRTFCPYFGAAMKMSGFTAMAIYSPWASSNTTLALRTSANTLANLEYKWSKPGYLFSATAQYNMNVIGSVSLGVWATYLRMNVTGDAELTFDSAAPAIFRQKQVTATMSQTIKQGGITLGITF